MCDNAHENNTIGEKMTTTTNDSKIEDEKKEEKNVLILSYARPNQFSLVSRSQHFNDFLIRMNDEKYNCHVIICRLVLACQFIFHSHLVRCFFPAIVGREHDRIYREISVDVRTNAPCTRRFFLYGK